MLRPIRLASLIAALIISCGSAQLAFAAAPTITTQPKSQTIKSGKTATMSVVATGTAPLTYQWYKGASGTTTSPISGATSASYTTPALTATTSYWVCLLYTSPSPRDGLLSRMPSSA